MLQKLKMFFYLLHKFPYFDIKPRKATDGDNQTTIGWITNDTSTNHIRRKRSTPNVHKNLEEIKLPKFLIKIHYQKHTHITNAHYGGYYAMLKC